MINGFLKNNTIWIGISFLMSEVLQNLKKFPIIELFLLPSCIKYGRSSGINLLYPALLPIELHVHHHNFCSLHLHSPTAVLSNVALSHSLFSLKHYFHQSDEFFLILYFLYAVS